MLLSEYEIADAFLMMEVRSGRTFPLQRKMIVPFL